MDTQQWVEMKINELIENSQTFPDQAFYRELKEIMTEQYHRIDQLQGELDGRMWSPEQW
ncbi:hypothetical protein [Paucilactobacillus nenjiangensis]|jgi:hypothetical protein|uniref:hypothetical protein n=1 Tax=Paucilactobacillus nenjiangensis TaxID=1296540 RepID=UPI003BB5A04D